MVHLAVWPVPVTMDNPTGSSSNDGLSTRDTQPGPQTRAARSRGLPFGMFRPHGGQDLSSSFPSIPKCDASAIPKRDMYVVNIECRSYITPLMYFVRSSVPDHLLWGVLLEVYLAYAA